MKKLIMVLLLLAVFMVMNSCGLFTGTVVFDNWKAYDCLCYIDGEYKGTVGHTIADWYLYAYNVPIGVHTLSAVGLSTFSTTMNITSGENWWSF